MSAAARAAVRTYLQRERTKVTRRERAVAGRPRPSVKVSPPSNRAKECLKSTAADAGCRGDKPAELLHGADPLYPEVAKAAELEGVVVLRGIIGVDGQVHDIVPLRSDHKV